MDAGPAEDAAHIPHWWGENMTEAMPWVTGRARVFGVIAHPCDHVRAPMVFNPLFAARDLPHVMVPIDAAPEDLTTVIDGLRAQQNFGGLAVTIPHKVALAALCDHLGTAAQLTGAVNAVKFGPDGSIHGDNFDGVGFTAGLAAHNHEIAGKNVLLLGAGGAARAIALALCEGGATVKVQNRSPEKAEALVGNLHELGGFDNVSVVSGHDGSGVDMIINTTSLGLHAGDALPLALEAVEPHTLICDIIMVPERTAWLEAAEARGLTTHYGRHMLDYQIPLIGSFIGAL